jgi:hypothetical protein
MYCFPFGGITPSKKEEKKHQKLKKIGVSLCESSLAKVCPCAA